MRSLLKGALAVFAIGLMAGVVLLGRAYRDAARTGGPLVQVETTVADLESRPLMLPEVGPRDPCPATPLSDIDVHYGGAARLSDVEGTGPVYGTGSPPSPTDWGDYYRVLYFIDPTVTGPVLIRARDLRTGQQVVFVDRFAAGAPSGRDLLSGEPVEQRAELVLHDGPGGVRLAGGWTTWHVTQGIQAGASGCTGFQVDGKDFSELVVVGD